MNDETQIERVKTAGRPTKIDEDTVAKLESVLKLGVTDTVACDYAEINPSTFYRRTQADEVFARKMRQARSYVRLSAGAVVVNSIARKNIDSAKWWLEKKHPDEFGNRPTTAIQINSMNDGLEIVVGEDKPE